jgi:hypothetical protein
MMGLSKQTEKWTIRLLGVVCLVLVFFLVKRTFSGSLAKVNAARPGTSPASRALAQRRGDAGAAARDDLARFNPQLNLELLKQIENHPLPESSRNPFEYPPPPKPKQTDAGERTPPPPPPPPTLPLKAIGYSVKVGNVPEAVVTDDQDIYVVHAGETFAKRYSVVSLTPNRIEIHDATTKQTVQLPIAP